MPTYRHRVIEAPEADQRLAKLAAEAAAARLFLPFTPATFFFVEDESGRYPRAVRCAAFIDHKRFEKRLDIFIRANLPPRQIAESVFHEAFHIYQSLHNLISSPDREKQADSFELAAPVGSTYESCCAELARGLVKWSLRNHDHAAAKRYHAELRAVDPAAAAALNDDVLSPTERRARIRLEAQAEREASRREVFLREKVEAFTRWAAEQKRQHQRNFSRC